ncbi:MAG: RsmD family RNA methyltransferase [Bacteroidia bacterium]|nr:RsmD family RNA methyltransferase [Bacteroidia bacterium]
MRIIGGTHRGRRFNPPADKWPTRPTTDIAKEGLFNILQHSISFEDLKMLDLFGGTGSHCYEFFSRGCRNMTYVDKHYPCVKFVKSQLKEFGAEEYVRVIRSDVFKFIRNTEETYDYIFAGPPYPLQSIPEIPDLIFDRGLLTSQGLLVLEHNPNHNFEEHPRYWKSRNYGSTIFSFFK